ncbi:hypothetical protein N8878_03395 [Psychromonas sp.]|nr:hypothetical protein [Psychromonas sp.]
MFKGLIKKSIYAAVYLLLVPVNQASANFIEMPEIEELRSIKEQTLLRDMHVPPVRDRSPDPTAGPRLAVSEFRIQGLVEFPELGITHEAIYALVESIRFDLMGEGKLLESGYTLEELAEVSDLLIDIEEETIERHVTTLEVQKLIWLIRSQQGKRGVTLGQIEGVANSITQFYRQRGFILAKAYIPKQEVRDGIVNLTVLLGMLGEVDVIGNKMYNDQYLKSVFDGNLHKPVTNQTIEENLYMINSFPGINVEGYFERGKQVGDTKLNVNVREENRFNFNARIDNHGSEDSGLYRLFFDMQANNLIGQADYLHLSALQTVIPDDTLFWKIKYASNFFSPYFRVGVDYSQNQFVSDQSSILSTLDLSGVVTVYGIEGEYIVQRSRKKNSNYKLRYENIDSDLQLGTIEDALDERMSRTSISYSFDYLDDVNKRLHDFKVQYDYGDFDYGFADGQEEKFHVVSLDYTVLNFVKVPFFNANSRAIFHSYGQYSGTNLSSTARFSLTGPTRVRGFEPSYFTADDAIYIGGEWVFNSPSFLDGTVYDVTFKDTFKPFIFADYAYGYQYLLFNEAGQEHATAHLADVGIGLQISHQSGIRGNIQLGFPILNELNIVGSDPEYDSMRLNFDLQYAF